MDAVPKFAKVNFIFLGVGTLICWNSILTALDYFSSKFPFNVPFLFGLPLFISTNLFSYLIYFIARYLSINFRMISTLLLMFIILIEIPIAAALLPNDYGFYLVIFLIFILGMANTIMQGSCFALASIFPSECVSYYCTGMGGAGTIICLLRILILLVFGADDESGIFIGTIIYFSISASFLLLTLIIYLFFCKSECYRTYLSTARKVKIRENIELVLKNNELILPLNEKENDNNNIKENYDYKWRFIYKVFLKILPFPILVWLIYVQTFMMFPGVCLKKEIKGLSPAWNATVLILIYNIFDTIGKYLSAYRDYYSKKTVILLVFFRFIFFVFFLLMATRDDVVIISEDWFAQVNMALFALTNGYTTSCAMVLAPELCENYEKETSGFLMTHPLYLGIMMGTFLALPFEGI